MTVNDLIIALSRYPGDALVAISRAGKYQFLPEGALYFREFSSMDMIDRRAFGFDGSEKAAILEHGVLSFPSGVSI